MRDPPIRRASPQNHLRATPELRRSIQRLAVSDLTMHDIADAVGVRNIGRVSEVLNGKR